MCCISPRRTAFFVILLFTTRNGIQPRVLYAKPHNGNQSDADLRGSAQSVHISRSKLQTVRELLTALKGDANVKMFRTTAVRVSDFLKVPVDQLEIDDLVNIGPEFRFYLGQCRYKPDSVRSYSNFARMLLQAAKELGWESIQPEIPEEWKAILAVMQQHRPGNKRGQY